MEDRLKKAFDSVKADSEIVKTTKKAVLEEMENKSKERFGALRFVLPVAACLVIMAFAVGFLYLTPTVCVSLDVNPSLELTLNRFDRVIDAKGLNEEGKELLNGLDLKHLPCETAIEKVMTCKTVETLLENDAVLEVGVVGEESGQTQRLISEIEKCTEEIGDTYCYRAGTEDIENARQLGLSYGRYKAYQELLGLGCDITADKLESMTMKEIRAMISSFQSDNEIADSEIQPATEGLHQGNGKHYGRGKNKNNN